MHKHTMETKINEPTILSSAEAHPLERMTLAGHTIRYAPSVADIPFDQLSKARGEGMLILDCDGTISRHNSPDIQPSSDKAIFDAFSHEIFSTLVLVSNNPNRSLMHARAKNLRVQPDEVYTPRRFREIKPASFMIRQAMDDHGFCPDTSVAVGDGVTDFIAYTRAAVPSVLVRPFSANEAKGYPLRPLVRRATNFLFRCHGLRAY